MVDQEIRVLGDENIIANPKNSQKQYPLTFKAVPNVIVYGRKKADLNFTVPIAEGTNFNFNLERTAIIFSDSFNLEEYSYIMVKNPFEEISDFFYVSSLEELDPTGKEFNEFNDEVVKWLRRLVNIISNRCMIFETTLFKDLNNFPNIKTGQTFIRTEDGWTGITIRDINSELDLIFNKYVEEINKKIQEHQVKMNELLEQWKQDIQKYAENVKQYEIVRIVTQTGHGFVFEPVMYSISQRKFVKAVFPHGADGIAVRVDDNNFRLVWAGRVEIPTTAKDTQQRDFVLGEYYFLGEGSNGGIQREKPDTYYQHLFQVMYSDELRQNIADVLLSVPVNQKGKRWDVGEAKTTVNDIEELKMSDFPVGKVVEVLGYYKAGDGADHKRIISTTDDGSGIQLNNGLWANIVHNGEVDVSWFGAKGDGVTDDTESLKKVFIKGNVNVICGHNKVYKANIILNKSNISITGLRLKGKISFDTGGIFIRLFNCDIDASNSDYGIYSIVNIPKFSMNNVHVHNALIDNIYLEDAWDYKFFNVSSTEAGNNNFYLSEFNDGTLIGTSYYAGNCGLKVVASSGCNFDMTIQECKKCGAYFQTITGSSAKLYLEQNGYQGISIPDNCQMFCEYCKGNDFTVYSIGGKGSDRESDTGLYCNECDSLRITGFSERHKNNGFRFTSNNKNLDVNVIDRTHIFNDYDMKVCVLKLLKSEKVQANIILNKDTNHNRYYFIPHLIKESNPAFLYVEATSSSTMVVRSVNDKKEAIENSVNLITYYAGIQY